MVTANIRAELARKNMDIQELAMCVGVTNATMSRWLNGHSVPTIDQAIAIAHELNCSLDYLFVESD